MEELKQLQLPRGPDDPQNVGSGPEGSNERHQKRYSSAAPHVNNVGSFGECGIEHPQDVRDSLEEILPADDVPSTVSHEQHGDLEDDLAAAAKELDNEGELEGLDLQERLDALLGPVLQSHPVMAYEANRDGMEIDSLDAHDGGLAQSSEEDTSTDGKYPHGLYQLVKVGKEEQNSTVVAKLQAPTAEYHRLCNDFISGCSQQQAARIHFKGLDEHVHLKVVGLPGPAELVQEYLQSKVLPTECIDPRHNP